MQFSSWNWKFGILGVSKGHCALMQGVDDIFLCCFVLVAVASFVGSQVSYIGAGTCQTI